MKIRVYVHNNKTQEGKDFQTFTAKMRKNNEWVNIIFASKLTKPEVDSIIFLDKDKIFKSLNENDKRTTYVITDYKKSEPIADTLVEEDFFF